jgi:hypothetical protein
MEGDGQNSHQQDENTQSDPDSAHPSMLSPSVRTSHASSRDRTFCVAVATATASAAVKLRRDRLSPRRQPVDRSDATADGRIVVDRPVSGR